MTRVEIIAHEALEAPLIEELMPIPANSHDSEGRSGKPFTLSRGVAGRGRSGSCFGDEVWPETNIRIVLFVESDEETRIRGALKRVRERFPKLGLAAFAASDYDEWYDGTEGDD